MWAKTLLRRAKFWYECWAWNLVIVDVMWKYMKWDDSTFLSEKKKFQRITKVYAFSMVHSFTVKSSLESSSRTLVQQVQEFGWWLSDIPITPWLKYIRSCISIWSVLLWGERPCVRIIHYNVRPSCGQKINHVWMVIQVRWSPIPAAWYTTFTPLAM
jgi:hypothetical protein